MAGGDALAPSLTTGPTPLSMAFLPMALLTMAILAMALLPMALLPMALLPMALLPMAPLTMALPTIDSTHYAPARASSLVLTDGSSISGNFPTAATPSTMAPLVIC